jgi:HEPN domain-containing protein
MADDPARIDSSRAWFVRAAEDIYCASLDLSGSPPPVRDALFHCEQAVEKALKGFLTWHDRPFRKNHDLVDLGKRCVRVDAELEPLLRRVGAFTEYASRFRYPGDLFDPTQAEAEGALVLTREVVDAILSRLPDPVRP